MFQKYGGVNIFGIQKDEFIIFIEKHRPSEDEEMSILKNKTSRAG